MDKHHRKITAILALAVLSFVGAGLISPASATADRSDGVTAQAGPFFWANVTGSNAAGTLKALDIRNLSTADGAVAQLWTYSGANHQRFYSDPIGSSVWKLRNVNSSKCLDTVGPSDADGTQVHQWTCYNTDSQAWRQERVGTRVVNGTTVTVYRWVNLWGRDTCLDNAAGSGNNGNKIQIWTCNGSDNQLWF